MPTDRVTRGFTLVEILLVASILMLLLGIMIPKLDDDARTARDTRRRWDLRSVQSALLEYQRANGSFPTTDGAWRGDAGNYGGLGYGPAGYIPGLVPDFLPALPRDPDGDFPAAEAGYMYRSDGRDFKFVVHETPEFFPPTDPFYDPQRPGTSWMVSTPGAYDW